MSAVLVRVDRLVNRRVSAISVRMDRLVFWNKGCVAFLHVHFGCPDHSLIRIPEVSHVTMYWGTWVSYPTPSTIPCTTRSLIAASVSWTIWLILL